MRESIKLPAAKSLTIIFLCFLLTSTGWLGWTYHLGSQISAGALDVMSMVVGYLLQAAGIGIFAAVVHRAPHLTHRVMFLALAANLAFMFPAIISSYTAGTLTFGLLMNIACGIIAGYYLYDLADRVGPERKASVFGVGYGLSILASWVLSLTDWYYSGKVLIICLVLTVVTMYAVRRFSDGENEQKNGFEENNRFRTDLSERKKTGQEMAASERGTEEKTASDGQKTQKSAKTDFFLYACVLVFLFSLLNSSGFAFPSADIGKYVNVELFRLVYAVGLMIAGFVTDKNRKYGAVCALTALVIPFIILSLRGTSVSAAVLWILGYFSFGFYAVYRIILFSDVASEKNLMYLSGFGLLFGRLGDALGEGICLSLEGYVTVFVSLAALLFAATVMVFFKVYHYLYEPEPSRRQSEEERFYQFSAQHDLSARERDVLRLLLKEKTNSEIANALSISENTVKFHVKNILQKTGCKNRNSLVFMYVGFFDE